MSIQDAIKAAVEGGWERKEWYYPDEMPKEPLPHEYLLDPLFWQALGKGLGWGNKYDLEPAKHNRSNYLEWLSHWHKFIDHLAAGKTIEQFFKELR